MVDMTPSERRKLGHEIAKLLESDKFLLDEVCAFIALPPPRPSYKNSKDAPSHLITALETINNPNKTK